MRVDWCVSSWFRIKNTHSLTEGLAVTHDDLQRPVRVIPENTRENPGIFGFYPGFLPFSACWPLNNSNNSNKQ